METILTASVFKESDTKYRAVLWSGHVTQHIDAVVFMVCSSCKNNIFQAAAAVKEEIVKWALKQEKHVVGVHTNDPCWPLDPRRVDICEAVQKTKELMAYPLGMMLVATQGKEGYLAELFPVSEIPSDLTADLRVGYCDHNFFQVMAELPGLADRSAQGRKIHDFTLNYQQLCWPEKFFPGELADPFPCTRREIIKRWQGEPS